MKSRIWTSHPRAGVRQRRSADVWPVLPHRLGAEIFAERWTPLIIRNLYLGCGRSGEILEGAPGLSRTLLSQRFQQLERLDFTDRQRTARYRLLIEHGETEICKTYPGALIGGLLLSTFALR